MVVKANLSGVKGSKSQVHKQEAVGLISISGKAGEGCNRRAGKHLRRIKALI